MTNHNHSNIQTDLSLTDRVLRWPEVQRRVGICRSHAHSLVTQGKFPRPIKLGARASGWLEKEINEWLVQRITASRAVEEVV